MAVITNLNTQQKPMAASGRTGVQVVKFIDAPRVYIKTVDSTPTPVTTKSNGVLPTGWTDLGIVNGKLKITYAKEIKEVRTGLDQVLRASYVGKKTAGMEFQLSQFDDVAMEQLSGVTPSVVSAGSTVQFALGSEDIIQKALLLVSQNKLDGKEWQFYHPDAYLTFSIADNGDETIITGTANLIAFPFNSLDTLLIQSMFS
jgi:hypothetical protein